MTGAAKRETLILLGLAILLTVVVAASLPQLEFQPGMPLPSLQPGQVVVVPLEENQSVSISVSTFFLTLVALFLTSTLLYVLYQMLRGTDWKLIADSLRYVLIVSLGIAGLVFLVMLFPHSDIAPPIDMPVATPKPVVTSPLGSAPPWLLWFVGIGLLVATVLVVMWIVASSRSSKPIDFVGLEAEKAMQALRGGVGLKDVIIRCYRQMSLALKQDQGIEREAFMTTGEFERLLERAGIPHEPIHQLTQLFDAVRYGNWQSNATDEQRAIRCLEAIMEHSRAARGRN
jgi:hypothetical protein